MTRGFPIYKYSCVSTNLRGNAVRDWKEEVAVTFAEFKYIY